jgi:hypothetical protein
MHRYRRIWVCSCSIDGKPGYHPHRLFGRHWPEWETFWEVTPEKAREWFNSNHQPLPDELRIVEPEPSGGRENAAATSDWSTGEDRTHKATGIDFHALYEALLRKRRVTSAQLVRFMSNKTSATFEDVMKGAFGKELEESTLRCYANRATKDLHELNARLWFETRAASIIRNIDPT